MRVRDVEIALVLAREMKDAAAREVDASLRLEQLKEVFGADELDAGERARIQTALQMAGLEPRPSLLEAGADEPIRFEVAADEATAAVATPARPALAEERQEFPTVGEFTRSTFRRFRERRRRKVEEPEEPVTTAEEPEPEPEPEPPVEPQEPVAYEEPEPVEPEEPANGHVDVTTNGNGHHVDLLDDVALPPHDTATPADFGASADTIDFDDPRLGEEWADEEDAEAEAEEAVLEYPEEPEYAYEPEPEPLPEPEALPEPEPPPQPEREPVAEAPGARVEEVAAILLPLIAVPVLVASLAGWSFGLPFVALALIATGVLVGRRGGFFRTLRESAAARTVAKATAAVTFASLGISIVLANVGNGSDSSTKTPTKPAAKTPTMPVHTTTSRSKTPAKPRSHKPKKERTPTTATTPSAPAPDPSTKGLIRVPPRTSTAPQSSTPTTPAATPGEPVPQGQNP